MRALRLAIAFMLVLGLAGCSSKDAVMPAVVGLRLDVALSDIERAGIRDTVEILGGGVFGVVEKANWQVCEQVPAAGEKVEGSAPRLTVARSCGNDESEPTATPTRIASEPVKPAPTEPEPAPSEDPSEEDPEGEPEASTPPSSSVTAKQVEQFLKESYGMKASKSWSSLCRVDDGFDPYPCAISKITLSYDVLYIRLQDSVSESEAERFAMYALNFLCASEESTKEFEEIAWVEISDTSGGARGQQSAAENLMCQKNG